MATLQTQLSVSPLTASPSRRANPGNPPPRDLAAGNPAPSHLTEVGRPYLVAGRRGRVASINPAEFQALPMESDDAKITGATRSLQRRLLALNLPRVRVAARPVATARPDTRTA